MPSPLLVTAAAFLLVLGLALLAAEWLARRNARLRGAFVGPVDRDPARPADEPGKTLGAD
jgi:hypothetical protein